ncbi:MAG TPA: ATP-binding protein [Candidatus Didemnitutus sp.]|nr:ATP-binding protein [Candidatus Didemnitutus sp.]
MAGAKPKAPVRSRAVKPPRAIAWLAETLAGLPDAALITRDRWEAGGAEIFFANAMFGTLTGYAPEELVGRSTLILHGAKTDLLGPGSSRSPLTGRLEASEGWLYRKNGTPFYAAWDSSAIRHQGKEAGARLFIYRDASEVKRLQQALQHSQKLDTVGQLASGVAHDFNNLLSIINGYCEIMSGKLAGAAAAQKDLQEIHRAGLKAAGIARQILEFSRRSETEVRAVNANTLIREIADILRRVVGDAVRVELRLDSDLGNMRIDPTQFQQVLLNLCFNARDAMPAGGKLTLHTTRREFGPGRPPPPGFRPGPCVLVEISDTGAGMDAAVQRRIFEPFFTTKPHGTGLGLPTVQGIVRQAEGVITVRSEIGAGTTFEIFLPETPEPEQLFSTALAPLPATRGTEPVWLIDSNEVLRKMVSGILSVDGYVLREFPSPEDAVAAIAAARTLPQLLLVDSNTPAAVDLARKLREKQNRLKVLSTAVDPPTRALKEFPAKNLAHLPKPFAISALLRAVRALLDAR